MITLKCKKDETKSRYWMLSLPIKYEDEDKDFAHLLGLDPDSKVIKCHVVGIEASRKSIPEKGQKSRLLKNADVNCFNHLIGKTIYLNDAVLLFNHLRECTSEQITEFNEQSIYKGYSLQEMNFLLQEIVAKDISQSCNNTDIDMHFN